MSRKLVFAMIFVLVGACYSQTGVIGSGASDSQTIPDSPSSTLKTRPDQARDGLPKMPDAAETQPTLAGHTATIALLSEVSSKAPSGSAFLARLEAPLGAAAQPLLPKGTLLEGHLDTKPARRLLKAGSLRMIFDRVKLPDGTVQRANISLIGIRNNRNVKTDDEGTLRPTVSKKRLAFDFGGSLLIAKLADDIAEEAVSASVGQARLYGMAAGGVFLALQKGREVKLRSGDVIEVEFGRAGDLVVVDKSPR